MDDDDDWQNCNLSKLKLEKEANEFQFLLNECRKWVETISGRQFLYDNDFRKSLENGVILCELLNVLKRDCIRRINRHSTPIAGIDNLNLFLKACQQHFSISQTHLFDPNDLEDLSIRALNNSVVSIDEQNRRLKKVVNTIYWLSRKTNEFGIPIDYYLDQTTLFSSSSLSNTHHHHNHHHITHKYTSISSSSSTNNNNNNNNNCGVGITSLLSTSTINSNSFCSNSSDHSSETSGYNSLSKLNNTNNNNHNNHNNNNNNTNQISNNNKLVGHHSRESSADSLNLLSFQSTTSTTTNSNITINNNNNNNNTDINNYDQSDRIMSYIYKQPITQSSQNKTSSTTNTTSSPLYDTSRSYTNNNNKLRTNSGTLLLNTSNNNTNNENIITRKDSVETLDSLSSSNSIKNNNQMKLNQNNNNNNSTISNLLSYNLGSQDELDNLLLNNNLPSPSSGVTSPSMLSYLSTSSNNINNISSTTTATTTITTTNTTVIPTRFTDRRVSSSAIQDPYKFNVNISEAGSRLARAAQEQLKISEKIKEAKKEIHTTNLNISNTSSTNGQLSARTTTTTTTLTSTSINGKQRKNSMNNDGEGLGEDWQNSVDDWKKRRKEKQKEKVSSVDTPTTPTTTTTTSFKTQLSYETPSTVKQNNTSSVNNNNNNNNISNKINIPTNRSHDHNSTKANNNSNFQQLKSKFNGNDDYDDDDDDDYKKLSSSPTKHTNPIQQQQTSPKHQVNQHYVQKLIKISRAHSYATRGFGFLINNVTTSNGKKCAQVVIVEPDSLAAKAGLEKNDQVIEINKQLTSDLTDEQLRKIIRERLQQNSVDLLILRAVNETEFQQQSQQNNTEIIINNKNNNNYNNDKNLFDSTDSLYSKIQPLAPPTTTQPPSVPATPPPPVPTPTTTTTTTTTTTQSFSNQNNSSNPTHPVMTNGHSNSQSSLQKYFAPKPFRKSLPNDLQQTTTTYHSTQNQNDNESSSVTPTQELNDMKNNNTNKTNNNNNNLYENSYSNETYQPPLPSTEPPPLPSSEPPSIKKNDPHESAINRALFDNIKIVDSWKVEQDLLLKKIYEEEQKRIDDLFKLNLEKVKEEETKRREEEKLKLEKEKLRLQDLEIKQRERQLQEKLRQQEEFKATSTLVADALQKKDLKSIIEKVYDQTDDKIEYEPLRTSRSDIASVRRIFENEKQNSPVGRRQPSPSQQPINGDVHQVIRKVHDSMDHLCNELLQKDMPSYAKDVHVMNQNLESARKKQEEVDRIKREQEMLKHEKERIEYEKEKLKKEAESLRQERELIILAASKKQQLFNDDSTIKHERQYSSEQDPGYGTMTELDYYKNSSFDENENILSKSTPSYSINNNKLQMDKNQRNKFGFSSAYTSPSTSLYNPNTSSTFQPQPAIPNYSLSSPIKPSPITTSTARKSAINKLSQAPRSKIFDVPNWGPSNKIQNFPMSHSYGNVNHWASEEAEKLRVAEQNYLQRPSQLVNTSQNNIRRSFPNLLESNNTFTSKSQSNINTSPTINNSTIKFNSPNSNRLTTSQHELYSPSKQAYSNLAYDTLRQSVPTIPLHDQLRHGYKDTLNQPHQQQQQQQKPVRSLSSLQKCANCSNEIGQSPAMVIEKLNLAYHLKCFRCTVCNITLSNGKEGTDVRVRGNKLHCNNCFSNEQGIKLSAV